MYVSPTKKQKTTQARYKWWLGTWNNPQEDWKTILENFTADFAIGQLEKGENGTPHLQFAIYFASSITAHRFKGKPCFIKGCPASDADKITAYCSKEDTRVEGPYQYGTRPSKAKRKDYDAALALIKERRPLEIEADVLLTCWSNIRKVESELAKPTGSETTRGIWIYGKPGVGKSHFVRSLTNNSQYDKSQNKWWDNYQYQDDVLLDDFDVGGRCLAHYLKIWADKYPFRAEIKGASISTNFKRFFVTSNYRIRDIFGQEDPILLSAIERRFSEIEFTEESKIEIGKLLVPNTEQIACQLWLEEKIRRLSERDAYLSSLIS